MAGIRALAYKFIPMLGIKKKEAPPQPGASFWAPKPRHVRRQPPLKKKTSEEFWKDNQTAPEPDLEGRFIKAFLSVKNAISEYAASLLHEKEEDEDGPTWDKIVKELHDRKEAAQAELLDAWERIKSNRARAGATSSEDEPENIAASMVARFKNVVKAMRDEKLKQEEIEMYGYPPSFVDESPQRYE